jgi:type II secretory pathway predicted ATPase ExeA
MSNYTDDGMTERLIAVCGVIGCGKTMMLRRLQHPTKP